MQSSLDEEMALLEVFNWNPLFDINDFPQAALMALAHTTEYYYYSLMFGNLVIGGGDIYGKEPGFIG